jgi:hypothetical protein
MVLALRHGLEVRAALADAHLFALAVAVPNAGLCFGSSSITCWRRSASTPGCRPTLRIGAYALDELDALHHDLVSRKTVTCRACLFPALITTTWSPTSGVVVTNRRG